MRRALKTNSLIIVSNHVESLYDDRWINDVLHYTGTGRRGIKIINYTYADVQIAGWSKRDFGWLAHYNGRPAGVIELGVPPTHKQEFYGVAKQLITGEDRENVYIQPQIKARVRMRNWTKSGMLRAPVFVDFVLTS
ncbi:hypothetical protein [Brevibacillus porteri]|uniref:hypothetical protein n=1 Tax=Brevibacillus porteri TaxID=2126350 RepID=UPI003D1A8233